MLASVLSVVLAIASCVATLTLGILVFGKPEIREYSLYWAGSGVVVSCIVLATGLFVTCHRFAPFPWSIADVTFVIITTIIAVISVGVVDVFFLWGFAMSMP